MLVVAMLGVAGCGNSGGSSTAASTLTPGSYTMSVITTDATNTLIGSQTTSIAVTVQ
jgi:predicted component of type VI protein secretion system